MDTKKSKKIWGGTSGLVSIDACIGLTVFFFLMLYLCSIFVVFEARNTMAHALLSTADSLALDAFLNESPDEHSVQELLYSLFDNRAAGEGTFIETDKWYAQTDIEQVVKTRFLAYLAGGDEEEAKRILQSLHVSNGVDGLNFSNSYVSNNRLYLVIEYEIEYEFQVFGLKGTKMSHSCCSKLWKN